jgi:DNA-binding HxlR family transcriptional regulator
LGPKTLGRLVALLHHRWAVPILAEVHRASGARFVTLARRLGMSRDSLKRTLAALDEAGLVVRNPGYGHPMRPEYILTPEGLRVAPWCVRVHKLVRALGVEDVALRKWSLAVALALEAGNGRFSEVRAFLPGITARALALTLKELQTAGLVERVVVDAYPPTPVYRLTRRGRRLAPLFASRLVP